MLLPEDLEHHKYKSEANFVGHLIDSEERWAYYKLYDNEQPSLEELKHLKGIVIPGSHHSVNDTKTPWI